MLHVSAEAIKPDKMQSLLVYRVLKKKCTWNSIYWDLWLKINLRHHEYFKANHPYLCKHESPTSIYETAVFSATCNPVRTISSEWTVNCTFKWISVEKMELN